MTQLYFIYFKSHHSNLCWSFSWLSGFELTLTWWFVGWSSPRMAHISRLIIGSLRKRQALSSARKPIDQQANRSNHLPMLRAKHPSSCLPHPNPLLGSRSENHGENADPYFTAGCFVAPSQKGKLIELEAVIAKWYG